jgi:NAD-dependent deacetylase
MKIDDALLQRAAHWIASSKRLCVLTGAGISRESGIPTFRNPADGWWAQYDPRRFATVAALHKNPSLPCNFTLSFARRSVPASRTLGIARWRRSNDSSFLTCQ